MTPYEFGCEMAVKEAGISPQLAQRLPHMAEVTGLGMLAVPVMNHMTRPQWLQSDARRQAMNTMELGGLGVLAAPSVYKLLQHLK